MFVQKKFSSSAKKDNLLLHFEEGFSKLIKHYYCFSILGLLVVFIFHSKRFWLKSVLDPTLSMIYLTAIFQLIRHSHLISNTSYFSPLHSIYKMHYCFVFLSARHFQFLSILTGSNTVVLVSQGKLLNAFRE